MPYGNKPKSMGLKKLAQANPDKLKYVGPAKYAPKKMGCSGGGPNMYKMGSKEKNTPMNFSEKAMMYMKNMPAMYGKPKMDGDPVKKEKLTERVKKETGTLTSSEAASMRKSIKDLKEGGHLNKVSQNADYSNVRETTKQFGERKKREYKQKFGEKQYNVRDAESDLRMLKEKGAGGRTKKDIEKYQAELAVAKQRVANAKKAKKASKNKK